MPKIRGCYNCSQRRIDCDRTTPICLKCSNTNLQCSGLGVRYRFSKGAAARGKWTNKTVPTTTFAKELLPTRSLPPIQWLQSEETAPLPTSPDTALPSLHIQSPLTPLTPPQAHIFSCAEDDVHIEQDAGLDDTQTECDNSGPVIDDREGISIFPASHISPEAQVILRKRSKNPHYQYSLCPSLEERNPHTRMLINNFSENVAPAMVLFDGPENKYRSILLPLAFQNQTIQYAVLASSAHSLSSKDRRFSKIALACQTAAIKGLTQKPLRDVPCDLTTLATIILLLVSEMVSGGDDFQLLYKLMRSCKELIHGTISAADSSFAAFLDEQTNIIDLFIQPLLGEETATARLTTDLAAPFGFVAMNTKLYPQHTETARRVETAICLASDIYCHRVLNDAPLEMTAEIVDSLKKVVEKMPSGSPAEHSLVWVYFVAAAESFTPEHRAFFVGRLTKLYQRMAFGNIPGCLEMLELIWKSPEVRWSKLITEIPQVLVM